MQFWEYQKLVQQERIKHPNWRDGQTAWNTLYGIDREIADAVRGTELDPFMDDTKLPGFYEFVLFNWRDE